MVPNMIDEVLGRDVESRTQLLLSRKEDQWFDRKSINISPKKLAETLVSFANAEGGVAVVGLSEGKIQTVEQFADHANTLRKTLSADYLEMPFPSHVEELEVTDKEGVSGHILVFHVQPGSRLFRTAAGTVFVRKGDSNLAQKHNEVRELEYARGISVFEAEPCAVKIDELNHEYLQNFIEATGATQGAEHLLRSRGMITDSGALTNAACLLFAEEPSRYIPGSEIRVIRYEGSEQLTGENQNIIFDKRTNLPIPQAIDQALEWVENCIPKRKALGTAHKFVNIPLAPKAAWAEGVVNAAIHRSYSFIGDHIRVEIFDDRLTITNPGSFRFNGDHYPNALEIARYARNPRIARTCTDLGYSQEIGEGIKRIYDEMRSAGLTEPMYEQPPMHVKLTLPFIARISHEQSDNLPRQASRILMALRALGGKGGTAELADQAGISKPTTRRTLQALMDQGLIEWEGKSPKDPRAFWVLKLH